MRTMTLLTLCLGGAVALSGCEQMSDEEVERALFNITMHRVSGSAAIAVDFYYFFMQRWFCINITS